jgi:uncharacterized membrane protein YgcG
MAHEESVLSFSSVYLFGRVVSDLKVVTEDPDESDRPAASGSNQFLREQFKHPAARLARIFAFSFEGIMYDLARPSLFLVQGTGHDIDAPLPKGNFARLARAPGRISRTGVGWQDGDFSMDMRVWIYDKGDFSMRLDVETGTLEHILLNSELDEEAWGGSGRSGSGRSGSGRSGSGRSGSGRSGSGRSGSGRSGS